MKGVVWARKSPGFDAKGSRNDCPQMKDNRTRLIQPIWKAQQCAETPNTFEAENVQNIESASIASVADAKPLSTSGTARPGHARSCRHPLFVERLTPAYRVPGGGAARRHRPCQQEFSFFAFLCWQFSDSKFWSSAGLSVDHRLKIAQQLGQGDLKTGCKHFKDAQTGLPTPVLQFRDMDSANS